MRSFELTRGQRLLQLGEPTEAVRAFYAALTEAPTSLEALLGIGRASNMAGHPESAKVAFAQALSHHPNQPEVVAELAALDAAAGDDAALGRLRHLANTARLHVRLGEVLTRRGDDAGAARAFETAGHMEPRDPELRIELGRLALARGNFTAAMAHFHEAGERLPDDGFPKLLEARAMAAAGQLGPAILVMTRAVQLAPSEPLVYREMCKLCLADGNPPGAVRAAEELGALEPARGEPVYLQGLAHLLAGEPDAAEAKLREALARDPALWQAELALAKVSALRGRASEATAALEKLCAAHPTEPDPANDLASLYLEQPGGRARAAALLGSVASAHPHHPATAYNLALALSASDPRRARALAEVAAQGQGALAAEARRLCAALDAEQG